MLPHRVDCRLTNAAEQTLFAIHPITLSATKSDYFEKKGKVDPFGENRSRVFPALTVSFVPF